MIIRPCTRDDFVAFYGKEPPWTLRALCAEQDRKIIGVGGYYMVDGAAFAFTDQKGMTKRQIVKAGRAIMKFLDTVKTEIVAMCGPDGDVAMKHYGFVPYGMVYRLPR